MIYLLYFLKYKIASRSCANQLGIGSAALTLPRHSPNPTPSPAYPTKITSSPSSRKVRFWPFTSHSFFPSYDNSKKLPNADSSGPLIVPDPRRSPVFIGHPPTV